MRAVFGHAVLALTLPRLWMPTGRGISSIINVSFTASVRQQRTQELKALALAVLTPGDAQYGKFLREGQIRSLTAPASSDMQSVTS